MIRLAVAVLICVGASGGAFAASAINLDKEPRSIFVTENGTRTVVLIPPGESVSICPAGCFVTMPDGKREVLVGFETIEISDGVGHLR